MKESVKAAINLVKDIEETGSFSPQDFGIAMKDPEFRKIFYEELQKKIDEEIINDIITDDEDEELKEQEQQ